MVVAVILNSARSGGTLLNRCLLTLPKSIVLSEVNPQIGGKMKELEQHSISSQTSIWYGIEIKKSNFREEFFQIYSYCQEKDLNLILRDWSFIDFWGNSTKTTETIGKSGVISFLQENGISFFCIAFIRNPIDTWISIGLHNPFKYFKSYWEYYLEINKNQIKIFRYEDFVLNPEIEFRELCKFLELPFSPNFVRDFYNQHNVLGDISLGVKSRGYNKMTLKVLKRKPISIFRYLLLLNSNYKQVCASFNYNSEFFTNGLTWKKIIAFNFNLLIRKITSLFWV